MTRLESSLTVQSKAPDWQSHHRSQISTSLHAFFRHSVTALLAVASVLLVIDCGDVLGSEVTVTVELCGSPNIESTTAQPRFRPTKVSNNADPSALDQSARQNEAQDLPPSPLVAQAAPEVKLEDVLTQGALRFSKDDHAVLDVPLKHTEVLANVSGFIARVKVRQTFINTFDEPIEATYLFPLPHESAVDAMTLEIGSRRIVGKIQKRSEARDIYERAISQGQTASLLEQQRPNVFVQTVGNVQPGEAVSIEITYVDVLSYVDGVYEFQYPMVVGPRYQEAQSAVDQQQAQAKVQGDKPKQDIVAPILPADSRSGHDVELHVQIDAGVPIHELESVNHEIFHVQPNEQSADVALSPQDSIPNRDFILRYKVAGEKPTVAMFTFTPDISTDAVESATQESGSSSPYQANDSDGYFLLMLQPKDPAIQLAQTPPREFVFLVDASGSMKGAKTTQVKACLKGMLQQCREIDRFQIIAFADSTKQLFDAPQLVNQDTIQQALAFGERVLQAGGGTEMLEGVKTAIDQPTSDDRIRIVVLLSDGFVGNESDVIAHVADNCGDQTRFWAVGIDSSPNMMLLNGIAKQGGGMSRILAPHADPQPVATQLMSRAQHAQLADITIDYGDTVVHETYPAKVPDLWYGEPVVVVGRYRPGKHSPVQVSGTVEGTPVTWTVDSPFDNRSSNHAVIAKSWARQKIEWLMQYSSYRGSPAIEEEVTAISLQYELMSPYTSFVAVDTSTPPDHTAQLPLPILVPLPLPAENFGATRRISSTRLSNQGIGQVGIEFVPELDIIMIHGNPGDVARIRSMIDSLESQQNPTSAFDVATFSRGNQEFQTPFQRSSILQPINQRNRFFESRSGFAQDAAGNYQFPTAGPTGMDGIESYFRKLNRFSSHSYDRRTPDATSEYSFLRSSSFLLGDASQESVRATPLSQFFGEESPNIEQKLLKLYEESQTQLEKGELLLAESTCVQAGLLLDIFLSKPSEATQGLPTDLVEHLASIRKARLAQLLTQFPQLSETTKLTFRELTPSEAISALGEVSGIEITFASGYSADEPLIPGGVAPSIDYLSLENVTQIDTFDYLMRTFALTWKLEEDHIVVGPAEYLCAEAAQFYLVPDLVTFHSKEVSQTPKQTEEQDDAPNSHTETGQFKLDSILKSKLKNDHGYPIAWRSENVLAVVGTAEFHRELNALLQQLRSGHAQLEGEASEWGETMATRASEFREAMTKWTQERALLRADQTIAIYAPILLNDALHGQLNDEAATKLTIAWRTIVFAQQESPDFDLESKPQDGARISAAWMISNAARALRRHPSSIGLARQSMLAIQPAAHRMAQQLQADPNNDAALRGVLLATLTFGLEHDYASTYARLLNLNEQPQEKVSTNAAIRTLAAQLMSKSDEASHDALMKLARGEFSHGEGIAQPVDAMLLAIACHNSSESAWRLFRESSPEYLQDIDPAGDAVIFATRLGNHRFVWETTSPYFRTIR